MLFCLSKFAILVATLAAATWVYDSLYKPYDDRNSYHRQNRPRQYLVPLHTLNE